MINIDSLDDFSQHYLTFLKKKIDSVILDEELYLAEGYSIVDSIEKDIKNINTTIEFFIKAKENNDELAVRAALLRIRCFMMGVYGVFYQTVEDIDRFMQLPKDEAFPDDYKIPEHYNYPLK